MSHHPFNSMKSPQESSVSANSFPWAHSSLCHTKKAQGEDNSFGLSTHSSQLLGLSYRESPQGEVGNSDISLMLKERRDCPPGLVQ